MAIWEVVIKLFKLTCIIFGYYFFTLLGQVKKNKMFIVLFFSFTYYGSWLSLAYETFFYYKTLTGPLFSGEYEMQDPKSPDEV